MGKQAMGKMPLTRVYTIWKETSIFLLTSVCLDKSDVANPAQGPVEPRCLRDPCPVFCLNKCRSQLVSLANKEAHNTFPVIVSDCKHQSPGIVS